MALHDDCPEGSGGSAQLVLRQSGRKDALNATLRLTITAARLPLLDYNVSSYHDAIAARSESGLVARVLWHRPTSGLRRVRTVRRPNLRCAMLRT